MRECEPKHFFPKGFKEAVQVIKDKLTKEDRRPHLVLSDSSKKTVRDWVLKPNPRHSEVNFIGVGKDNFIDTIYAPEGDFSPNSNLVILGRTFKTETDLEELRLLWKRVYVDGRLNEIYFLGHLHPSGNFQMSLEGKITNIINNPQDGLLCPSEGDILSFKDFAKLNPNINLHSEAIAANTQDGPRLRIYLFSELMKAKIEKHVWDIPYQTVQLT